MKIYNAVSRTLYDVYFHLFLETGKGGNMVCLEPIWEFLV